MEAPAVAAERGSTKILDEILKRGTKIAVPEMAHIATLAEAAGGHLSGVDPDGDWCGTGKIHIKWPPPKRDDFLALVDYLVAKYINHEIIINGIPVPEYIIMNVSRQIGRQRF